MEQKVDSYTPVSPDFHDIINDPKIRAKNGPVHFFKGFKEIDTYHGCIAHLQRNQEGEFLVLDTEEKIRLDKIVTLFGRPGPAYDQYDAYANACFSCMGGMD
ncbi:MAG: hypothetical protein ACFCUU_18100 [Cyclobacteriaceae bacterium]